MSHFMNDRWNDYLKDQYSEHISEIIKKDVKETHNYCDWGHYDTHCDNYPCGQIYCSKDICCDKDIINGPCTIITFEENLKEGME